MRIRSTSPIGASRSLVPLASLAVTITCGFLTAILATRPAAAQTSETASQPLRIIFFGAHPDDAEYKAGGTAAMWAARGHQVKLVSVTNGDIGHWDMAGGPLARRRRPKWRKSEESISTTELIEPVTAKIRARPPATARRSGRIRSATPVPKAVPVRTRHRRRDRSGVRAKGRRADGSRFANLRRERRKDGPQPARIGTREASPMAVGPMGPAAIGRSERSSAATARSGAKRSATPRRSRSASTDANPAKMRFEICSRFFRRSDRVGLDQDEEDVAPGRPARDGRDRDVGGHHRGGHPHAASDGGGTATGPGKPGRAPRTGRRISYSSCSITWAKNGSVVTAAKKA